MAESLSRYSIPPEQYAALRARQVSDRVAIGAVDKIRFEGLERTNPEVLRTLVKSKPGEPLTEEKVGADMRRIYGRGDFESVDYQIMREGRAARAGDQAARGTMPGGRTTCASAWVSESDFQGDNAFNLLVQYRTHLGQQAGRRVADGGAGGAGYAPVQRALSSRCTRPGVWFGSLYGQVGQATRGVFSGDDKSRGVPGGQRARRASTLGALLGTIRSTLRFGAHVESGPRARSRPVSPVLPAARRSSPRAGACCI